LLSVSSSLQLGVFYSRLTYADLVKIKIPSPIYVYSLSIQPTGIGFVFNEHLSSQISKSCYFYMREIFSVQSYIKVKTAITVVNTSLLFKNLTIIEYSSLLTSSRRGP